MALLDSFDLNRKLTSAETHLAEGMKGPILAAIKALFWIWYGEHEEDVLLEKKFLFIPVKFRVKDLYSVFVLLFGEAR